MTTEKKPLVPGADAPIRYTQAPPVAPLRAAEASASYGADPTTRIALIREGIPAAAVGTLAARMGMSKELMLASLGLSRATISRKEREAARLSSDETERVLGFDTLIGQVETMVAQSGDAQLAAAAGFDAAHWLAGWLSTPLPALGGLAPASYMDTFEGQKLVGDTLAMAQSGAYA
ncbi:MAG: hypothetical protein JWP59_4185 [Massilia sp.]|jgi:putative toxin-antitoxin system antitoxin component (TIGR02293 family)|nr:hypothetical protein [Massilia sp.]